MKEHQLTTFWIADWFVDAKSNRIQNGDLVRRLEKRTMNVLVKLAELDGKTASKDEIIASAWPTHVVSDQSVATAISDLRKALNDDRRQPEYIETIPKRGYRLISPVTQSRQCKEESKTEFVASRVTRRQTTPRTDKRWHAAAAIGIGAVSLLFTSYHAPVSSGVISTAPIVVGDICVGDVDTALQDLAYGFNELLTVELGNLSNRTVIRVADENEFATDLDTHSSPQQSPILIDSAIIESGSGSIVVLEALDGRTKQLLWGEKYPISSHSIESVALGVSEEILAIDSAHLTSSVRD